MPQSLRSSISEPQYTKAVIKSALRSAGGAARVWCVVESYDDVSVYGKFFETTVTILPSEGEDGKMSCRNVEEIVTQLYEEEDNPRLIGIRDCDYTRYVSGYHCPDNVFQTDCRDIEMMMLGSDSVIANLKSWNAAFPQKIADSSKVMRYLGYLRIYNELRQASCIFKDKLTKQKLVWDEKAHIVVSGYQRNLFDKFKSLCDANPDLTITVTEEDFNNMVVTLHLDAEPYYYVCRGHDVLRLLSWMMINTNEFTSKTIFERMSEAYSLEDFTNTSLCQNIKNWTESRGVNIIINK